MKNTQRCRIYAYEYCETLNVRMPFYFVILGDVEKREIKERN